MILCHCQGRILKVSPTKEFLVAGPGTNYSHVLKSFAWGRGLLFGCPMVWVRNGDQFRFSLTRGCREQVVSNQLRHVNADIRVSNLCP